MTTVTERCRRARAERLAKGQCWFCTRRPAPHSKHTCAVHLAYQARRVHHVTPQTTKWKPGGMGRPPLFLKDRDA